MDYCKTELDGLPAKTLPCVQNASARLIFHLRPCDHISNFEAYARAALAADAFWNLIKKL